LTQPEPLTEDLLPEDLPFQIVDMTTGPLPPQSEGYAGAAANTEPEPEEKVRSHSVSTKPPSADEWTDFIGCTVFRLLSEGYLWLVLFRHIDESDLTPREREKIKLTADDLRDIAAPFGTVASKNKHARKHGRTIIAASETYESVIDLFIWMKRVNRIARKYRRVTVVDQNVTEGTVIPDGEVPRANEETGQPGGRPAGPPPVVPNFGGIIPGTGG
jgi:hypothetical protein